MGYKKRLGQLYAFLVQYRKWRKVIPVSDKVSGEVKRLVIIPCDPWSVGGSRGDEAMIMSVIQCYRKTFSSAPIIVVTGNETGDRYVSNLPVDGVSSIPAWNGNYPMERIYHAVMEQKPSHVVLLGADCMDGFYSPAISLTLLGLHDLFSRTSGVESRLMGFSFNADPYWPMCFAFRCISDETLINLRDEVSLERFRKKTKSPAGLVADSAFMLSPDYGFSGYRDLEDWVSIRRNAGAKYIIGVNFHPMLRKYDGLDSIKEDAIILARNIETILREDHATDFVLIPHDDRSKLTDNLMLGTMADYLYGKGFAERIYYRPEVYRATQLKALCRLLDGLVSSRMHLAIAALGQGKSVLAASYQGKFEGLFRHFNIPEDYLLPPDVFISDQMVEVFHRYIKNLPQLTFQVETMLPSVTLLSEKNMQ